MGGGPPPWTAGASGHTQDEMNLENTELRLVWKHAEDYVTDRAKGLAKAQMDPGYILRAEDRNAMAQAWASKCPTKQPPALEH